MSEIKALVEQNLNNTVDEITVPESLKHYAGKVRENVAIGKGKRAIIVTDRISAFDFNLGTIPFKGQVLNQISSWWFGQVGSRVPHHFIESPDGNISIVKEAKVLPVEVVVRGYLTGSTATSSWYAYQNHNRVICGIKMPDGMVKNQKFEQAIITPTTKPAVGSKSHDEPITREEIIKNKLVEEELYKKVEDYALKLFKIGQDIAKERGLILVDTKYEFGLDENGDLMVIDEIHTPDSSRYWTLKTYQERMEKGQEPDMYDKEFVRRQLVKNGIDIHADPETYDGGKFLNNELKVEASLRYMQVFKDITGQEFVPETGNASLRITEKLKEVTKD